MIAALDSEPSWHRRCLPPSQGLRSQEKLRCASRSLPASCPTTGGDPFWNGDEGSKDRSRSSITRG